MVDVVWCSLSSSLFVTMLYIRRISLLIRRSSLFASPLSDISVSHNNFRSAGLNHNRDLDSEEHLQTSLDNPAMKQEKDRKGRFAFLLCYHGEKYFGIQYNTHGPTIEREFFNALQKAGYIDESENHNAHFHLGYNRASRTDSGVSALRQVVSLNLPLSVNIEKINEFLPSDIRVLGKKRTTRNFDAQLKCEARSYCYIMPTYAFCHKWQSCEEKEKYRIDADTLSRASEIFKVFEGHHRFHNYTEKRDYWDQRSVRSIMECSVSEAFLLGELEMVELHVTGGSFMLHQIRRMIGMTIAIMRGKFPYHFLKDTLEQPVMPTPTAPSLGLILEKQYFSSYNKKFAHVREPLTWEEYDHEVDKFKMEQIVPRIVQIELEEGSMLEFLNEKLRKHSLRVPEECTKLRTLLNWTEMSLQEIDEMLADKNLNIDEE